MTGLVFREQARAASGAPAITLPLQQVASGAYHVVITDERGARCTLPLVVE